MLELKNENNKFYSMISDTTIKYLFKNNETRKILEKVINELTDIDLSNYNLIDNELNTGNMIKDYRLDLLFEHDDKVVLIEMNKKIDSYTINKNYSYLYRVAGNMYKEGDNYKKKKYATLINFNNAMFPIKGEKGTLTYNLMNERYKLKLEGIKSIEIYLENYKGICYDKENELEMFLSLFTAENYEEQRKLESAARETGYEEGVAFGVKQGHEIGVQEGYSLSKNEIAKSLRKENVDIEIISKTTGLLVEEINSL